MHVILKIEAATRNRGKGKHIIDGGGPDHTGTDHIQNPGPFSSETSPELAEVVGPLQKNHNHNRLIQVLDLIEVKHFDTYWRGSRRFRHACHAWRGAEIRTPPTPIER